MPSVAVTSRSFSRHPELRALVLARYSDAKFNDDGLSLQGKSLIEYLSGYEKDLSKLYFSHTKRLAGDVKTFYGAGDVFNWASKIGISTSIITAKPRENAELLCDKLNIPVDFLVCGDDYRHGKPNAFVADAV